MKTIKSLATMLLAVNLLASFAHGASVSYDDAKNVALNLIYSKTGKSVSVDDSILDSSTADKEFHIIRLKPKGWVIVSGDDSIEPIIAWSTESSLGSRDSLPAGFVAWMEKIEMQIQKAKDTETQSAALEEKWKKLTAYPEDFRVDGSLYQSNDGYVQDVILDISPTESDSEQSATVTASGSKIADGWYAVDVASDGSSVDYAQSSDSDGSLGGKLFPEHFTSFSASDGTNSNGVMLKWTGGDDAMYFRTFRNNEDISGKIGGGKRSWLDTTAITDKTYRYFMRAYGPAGYVWSSTDYGRRGSTTPPTPTKPATPTGISASDGTYTTGVMISNYSVPNATGYKIYRNGIYKGLTTGIRILDTTATPGIYYNYSVKANNSAGDSLMSAPDKGWRAKTASTLPATPSISATDGTLTSGVVIKYYSAKATSYKVYRNGAFIGATTGTSFKDTKGYPGKKYTYSAKACNSSGCSGLAYDIGWRASAKPAAPSGVSATDGTLTSGVVIKWGSVSKATHYKVYRSSTFVGITSALSFKDTKAYPGRKYYYSVKAGNSYGDSSMSSSDIGWKAKPAAPKGVSASHGTLTSGVLVKWGSVSGAVQYLIYRDGVYKDAAYGTSWKDETAWQDHKYNYSVKAKDKAGVKSDMSASDEGWRKRLPSPINVRASTNMEHGIWVEWDEVSGATNKLYRFHPSYLEPKLIHHGYSITPYYLDVTAAYDTKYSYYVTACNSGGCSVSSYAALGIRESFIPKSIDASDGLTSGIVLKDYSVSGAGSYKFYRSTFPDGRNPTVLTVHSAPTSWKDTYAKPDTFYYYRVKACNYLGRCFDLSTAVDRGWRRR